MNIILDTSTLQEQMSGTGYYTRGMLRELLQLDSVDTVQTLGGSQQLLQELDNGKIEYHFPNENHWHRLINLEMLANRPNIKGDVALFPNYFMPFGFSTPSIVTIHDLSFLSHPHFYRWKMKTFYRHRIKHTYKNAALILTVSQESKKHIAEYSGRPVEDIIVIPPGPSLPLSSTSFLSNAPSKYFLWNGNIEPRKNVNPTVKAFLEAKPNDYHLVIVGKKFCSHRYWNEFIQLVEQSNRIHYLGYIDNEELEQWYAGARGVVCCSFVEGLGIPLINAGAMQKPCLISNHPALKEAAGNEAITVNPNDQNSLVNGFNRLAGYQFSDHQEAVQHYASKYQEHWHHFSHHLEEVIHKTAFNINDAAVVSFSQLKLSALKRAILKTLAYSAVFNSPMLLKECYRELHHKSCSFKQFEQALKELSIEYPDLVTTDGRYTGLKPFIKSIESHQQTFEENTRFIETHQWLIRIISKLPWVSGIYFSGGTIHASHLSKQDLDLFILAKKNRVWPVYTLLKFLAISTQTRELLCFNYLIDKDNLHIHSQRDLYTAHQILHLRPAIENVSQPDLKVANPWIYDFFPNSQKGKSDGDKEKKLPDTSHQNWFMEAINILLMSLWGWFWKHKNVQNRTGGIRWDAHQIKLHTHDHRPWVYKRFSSIQADIQQQLGDNFEKEYDYENSTNKGCA